MKRSITLFLFLLFATAAMAEGVEEKLVGITVGLHCCSDHTPDPGRRANNGNLGLFIRFGNGFGVGFLKNSINKDSVHVDYTTDEYYRLRGTIGYMNGYDSVAQREWIPFYMVTVRLVTVEKIDVLLGYTTDGNNELKHLMLSRRF